MKLSKTRKSIQLLLVLMLALPGLALSQDEAEAKANGESKEEEKKPKTIAELTEGAERYDGFFTLFRNKKTGETHMLVKADQVGQEFIYWIQVANGVPGVGYFKGAYGPSGMLSIQRHFDRLEFVAENTNFYFDPDNAVSRASEANISDALLHTEKIVAEDEDSGDILIKTDKLFASESLAQITPSPNPDADPKTDFALGKVDSGKTKVLNLRSYPKNTDVEVEYVFSNPTPRVLGGMGFFSLQVTDLTSMEAAPYRDMIRRWHLVKQDPDAELSEPVEPITWWIENTTPQEWRELIREAALRWNSAFEKAGFRNAMVVKVQPDDAEWDAGDIRYNVLRWTSSPNPPFGGYGPSFSDPRTGQLIGADVMLEYSFMSRWPRMRAFMQDGADTKFWGEPEGIYCTLGHTLQLNSGFGRLAAETLYGFDDELDQRLAHDTMSYLILHEIGHTLGMNHNMKATQYLTPDEAFDSEVVDERGLAGSVMDYPALNFAPSRDEQTRFYLTHPGPYDDWFIEYGYSMALDDPAAEAARLEAILSRSTEPDLAFGNDADDMRSPGQGIDPRVNIYDMSADAVAYASGAMELYSDTLNGMVDKFPAEGKSYEETWQGVSTLMTLWARSAAVVSRYIGGVYVDRSVVGQDGATQPFTPVPLNKQRQAMKVLSEQVFAPDSFEVPAELLAHTAKQRRGFDHFTTTEDPKHHDAVLAIQKGVLDHLLHPVVTKRISDSALYGNRYSLADAMGDLTDAIFEADIRGNVSTIRQNLQMEYVQRLVKMTKNGYDTPSQSMAVYTLNQIDDMLGSRRAGDVATQAHTQNLRLTIERALSPDA